MIIIRIIIIIFVITAINSLSLNFVKNEKIYGLHVLALIIKEFQLKNFLNYFLLKIEYQYFHPNQIQI